MGRTSIVAKSSGRSGENGLKQKKTEPGSGLGTPRSQSFSCRDGKAALLAGVEPVFRRFLIHNVPPVADIFRPAILVLQII